MEERGWRARGLIGGGGPDGPVRRARADPDVAKRPAHAPGEDQHVGPGAGPVLC